MIKMIKGKTCSKAVFLLSVFSICAISLTSAQVNKDSLKLYPGGEFYPVGKYEYTGKAAKPKNVILMIGDGMGPAQLYAAITANGGDLNINNFKHVGFSTTYCANRFVTGSAASATALATGTKTNYRFIGVDPDTNKLVNIREVSQNMGKATGVVSTSSVTHATPAGFVAHQVDRGMEEAIAVDFVNSGIDVFIGGGYDFFAKRKDGQNLMKELESDGYAIVTETNDLKGIERGKLAALLAPNGAPRVDERGDMLETATSTAIKILDKDPDGFFLMVEGSQPDWGGHDNDLNYIIEEVLDFDKAVGIALEYASRNKETLLIVTADHETGGLTIEDGNLQTGMVRGDFTSGGHTGIMVPVFAFGPGAEKFTGFMDNTDIPNRIKELLK
jgi:alkaline phosphatase